MRTECGCYCVDVSQAGCTALHSAAQKGHNQCARILLYAGCAVDAKNNVSKIHV